MIDILRVLLIGDSDSQLHYCHVLSQIPENTAIEFTLNAVPREGTPDNIFLQFKTISRLWHYSIDQLLRQPSLDDFDAIGVCLTGSQIASFRASYLDICNQKGWQAAILFCGFNGVVLENFEEGISWRIGYDLICLNGPRDMKKLQRFLRFTPFASQQTVITGLRRRNNPCQTELKSARINRSKQFVFAEQVLMPRKPVDRYQMVGILADLARRSPEWKVIIKPRVKPGERTFHQGFEHISQTIGKSIGVPPRNFIVSDESLENLLISSQLMCTVSSTAVFDALDLGCHPLVMADLGWGGGNGTSFFRNSGILYPLKKIKDLDEFRAELKSPNPAWLRWVGYHEDYNVCNLYAKIRELRSCLPSSHNSLSSLRGYEIAHVCSDALGVLGYTVNQLRSEAEEAIQQKQWQKAEQLLREAWQQRPKNRNIKRRLKAVQSNDKFLRKIRLMLTPRFKPKA